MFLMPYEIFIKIVYYLVYKSQPHAVSNSAFHEMFRHSAKCQVTLNTCCNSIVLSTIVSVQKYWTICEESTMNLNEGCSVY